MTSEIPEPAAAIASCFIALEMSSLVSMISPTLSSRHMLLIRSRDAFLYRILELYKYSGNKINLARLAYLLARLEPSKDATDEYRQLYDELKQKLYEWHRNEKDRKEFITAVYIYIYMIRDREEE